MDIFTVCTIYVAFQNAAWNQFKMQRKNKFVVLWKTTLLSKKDQSPKKTPEYKVNICIVVVGFIQKFFHIKFWKKNFPKNPFLIKTFCYRNCTLYEAEILWSLSFSFRNLIRIQHRILNQLYCFVHFLKSIFFNWSIMGRSDTQKYLGKTRFFWWIWEIVSKLNLYPTFLVPKLN